MTAYGEACFVHRAPDVDEIVCDDAEADPPVHTGIAFVAAVVQTMSPFHDADASLGPGARFLAVAELALFLLAFTFGALSGAIGNARALERARAAPSHGGAQFPGFERHKRGWPQDGAGSRMANKGANSNTPPNAKAFTYAARLHQQKCRRSIRVATQVPSATGRTTGKPRGSI